MNDVCYLIHVRCGACGQAIHKDGGCGCDDNRHHPIADLQRCIVSRLRAELKETEECFDEANQFIAEYLDKIKQLEEACEFAHGAILDAVCTEDGLDGDSGLAVMRMIEDAVPAIKKRVAETTGTEEVI